MARQYKMNQIKINIESYVQYWLGTAGIGKTTLFRDLIMKEYGDPKHGLLISLGNEIGYTSLTNLYAEDCKDWFTFEKVVDDLVLHKADNEFKVIGLDTVDELVSIAEQYAMYEHKIRNNGVSATSLKACLGGYGAGSKFAREQITVQVSRLRRAGYGLVYIGHTKYRDLVDKDTDKTYQMLTTNMEFAYHSIFANTCDIMAMMHTKKTIQNDKLTNEVRTIRFRGNTAIESKSRISSLPEEISFDIDVYLKTVKDALEREAGITDKSIADKRREEERVLEADAQEIASVQQESLYGEFESLIAYRDNMLRIVSTLPAEDATAMKARLIREELPVPFSTVEDIEVLKQIYAIITK